MTEARTNQVANGLLALGIQPGDRIGSLAKNTDVYYEMLFGAAKARAVMNGVNTRLAAPEVKFILSDARAKVLFVGKEFYASGQDDGATIFVGDQNNRIETRMRLVNRSAYDTLVSTRLSGTALSALGGFFGNASPRQVSVCQGCGAMRSVPPRSMSSTMADF